MNRHLYGDTMPCEAVVPDCVKVMPGDLMWLAVGTMHQVINRNLWAKSGLTNYAYPFASGNTGTANLKMSGPTAPFCGVALDGSEYGATDTISIATAGVFEFPLTTQAGVTCGKIVQAHIPTGYAPKSNTTASYEVIQNSGGGVSIGYCVRTEAAATTVRVLIGTAFGPGGLSGTTN